MKLNIGYTIYRKGEGLIANIARPTIDWYEIDNEGLTLHEMIVEGKMNKKFLRREGPEVKEEENWAGSSEAEQGPVKA